MTSALMLAAWLAQASPAPSPAPSSSVSSSTATYAQLRQLIADYVGLYRRETLEQWRALFLPSFTVASTRPDGTVLQRTLEEFYEAQRKYLGSGREIREVLENVRVERHGRLASAWADFVLADAGEVSRGKLVLLFVEEKGSFKIHALIFSYHG